MKSKSDPRHEARRIALATLFGRSFLSGSVNELAQEKLGENFDPKLTKTLINGVAKNQKEIDQIIKAAAPEWPLDQIARVDLICLRLAVFELHVAREVPHKVAIDEAIELAKEFGTEQSGKFVNGVLGTIVKTLMPEKE
jgi:N utilization substance protein B